MQKNSCIHELYQMQVAQTPDAVAVIFKDQHLTYRELNYRSNQLAHLLLNHGIGPESLVGICMERSIDMVISVLGILKAGGAYVPFDPALPKKRLRLMLEDAPISLVLTQSRLQDVLPKSPLRRIYLDSHRGTLEGECEANPVDKTNPGNIAYVIFTSGSTGRPKGVAMPHQALVNLIEWQKQNSVCGIGERTLQFAPLSFDVSFQEMFSTWHSGGTLVLITDELRHQLHAFWNFLCDYEIERLFLPPVMLELLAQEAERLHLAPASLREVICAGEQLHITSAIRRLFGWLSNSELVNQYGPTETHVVTAYRMNGFSTQWPSLPPIGKPISNVKLTILDDSLQPIPVGDEGELYIGGTCLARGYLNRAEMTRERFVPDPFENSDDTRLYKTGDICKLRADGNFEFVERRDHQIKIRGFRIEKGEVETALASHPWVSDCAIITRGEGNDKHLLACVVPDKEYTISPDILRHHLSQMLPEYMLPSEFIEIASLPRTLNGKINYNALSTLSDERDKNDKFIEADSETERILAVIWSEALGVSRIGRYDDFFALGGQSLTAMKVIARVAERFGVELTHRTILEASTIAGLAAKIDRIRPATPRAADEVPVNPVSFDAKAPLSWGQTEIWLAAQVHLSAPVYNEPFTIHLNGPIDVTALEAALLKIMRRHAALRTGFITEYGHPVQVVWEDCRFSLFAADLESLSLQERQSKALDLANKEACRPFDLARPPLWRALLVRMTDSDYRLYLTFHHIIIDAYSIYNVFLPELWQLYESYRTCKLSSLPDLPLQYADYVHWQRNRLTGSSLYKCRAYWKKQLSDAQMVELPTTRLGPVVPDYQGSYVNFSLPRALTENLIALSRRSGTTLFVTLLAAFKILLWRYTQSEDVIVGTVDAGRSRTQFEHIIGYFLSTLVLRTSMSGDLTFLQLQQRIQEVMLNADAHKDLPFLKLVEELQLIHDRTRRQLFQVAFVMEPTLLTHESGWTVDQYDVQTGTTKFDLTVELEARENGVIGRFQYRHNLFDDTTIRHMTQHFRILLEGIVTDPERSISTLPMLLENETPKPHKRRKPQSLEACCIHELFEAQAEQIPESIAVTFENQHMTYQMLNQRANRLAHRLCQIGVGPETLVAICVERSLEMVVGILGILKAGGAYVPLDPLYPEERLALLLDDARPTVLVTEEYLRKRLPVCDAHIVTLENLSGNGETASYANPDIYVQPENLAYVIYTSGSTGKPKGVMVSHLNVVRLFTETEQVFHFGPEDIWTLFHSYAFDFSVWEIWGPLLYGGRLVVVPHWLSRTPDRFYQLLVAEKVTILNQTPSAFKQLLNVEETSGMKKHSLRFIVFGGEALDLSSLQPWFKRHGDQRPQLVNMYGITETTVHATYRLLSASDLHRAPASLIGKPIPDLQLYLLDCNLQPVPVGVPGEIHIDGAGVARGYLNQPQLTDERFITNPFTQNPAERFYRTGDRARYLIDGELEYLGRTDEQIKIRGFRIEPGEIEAVLKAEHGVEQCVVIAREDTPGDKRLVAYLVTNPEAQMIDAMRKRVKQKLPDYMTPSAFVILNKLPLTLNGKVDRKALPPPGLSDVDMKQEIVKARNALEFQLKAIWERVLNIKSISINDNFFDIGGHSLLAVKLFSEIEKVTGKNLPLATLFQAPTVEQLADVLREQETKDLPTSALVRIQPYGSRPPFFCVHGHLGNVLIFADLVQYLDKEQPFYGLQAIGLTDNQPPITEIKTMAAKYIEEMLTVQPKGPYYLGGYCFGGMVALEMAHQLQSMDRQVAFLAMFDIVPFMFPKLVTPIILKRYRQYASDHLYKRYLTQLTYHNTIKERLNYLLTGFFHRMLVPNIQSAMWTVIRAIYGSQYDHALSKFFHNVETANLVASKGYEPCMYPGNITLFLSKESANATSDDPDCDWLGIARGVTDVRLISDTGVPNIGMMFKEPYVQDLADQLTDCLNAAQTHAEKGSS